MKDLWVGLHKQVMCRVHVFYCPSCDTLSPIPVSSREEEKPGCQPHYLLVDDQRCKRRFDCARQSQADTAYAPSALERRQQGEGPCLWSCAVAQSGRFDQGCLTAECGLVRVTRDCRDVAKPLLSHEHLQRLVQATGQWRPPCRWIVRKSVNPFNTQ